MKITQRDVAERILDILVKDLRLKPGDPVPDQALKTQYRSGGGDAGNIKDGLKYAGDNEWLTYDPSKDAWYLTELGHEYAL
jgi:hypothetical protein